MQHLDAQCISVIKALCQDAESPRSLAVWLMVKNREWEQLFSLKTDPAHYLDAESYFRDVSCSDFLRKLDMKIPGIDLESNARALFRECEAQNKKTNDRLACYIENGPFVEPSQLRILDILSKMRQTASQILGKLPNELDMFFGPGATFVDRGRLCTIPDKISSHPAITDAARCLLPFWRETAWARACILDNSSTSEPQSIRGNRFTTVPKDALKLRGIGVEPSLNVSFQLSVGKIIRSKLKKFGIDLLTAQPIHRSVAATASKTGEYATIDLSNASDTISYNLVKLIIPSDWFSLLDSLRSPSTLMDGKWFHLEKFSSMGNGYTFELETLLFLVIIATLMAESSIEPIPGGNFWVYGDDLIVPTEVARDVVACLSYFGLKTNPKKTFLTGRFRESCGGDFFDGVAVRPHYLKEFPDEPQKVIALANGIRRMAQSHLSNPTRGRRYKRAWMRCLDMLPNHIRRLRGPESLGDLVINDSSGWLFRETVDKRGFIRVYMPISRAVGLLHWKPNTILASALYGVPSAGPTPRGSVEGYRLKWISCLERETTTAPSF